LLHAVWRRARTRGARTLLGELVPSKKNAVAAGFFAETGFAPIEGEAQRWRLDLTGEPPVSDLFEVIEEA
jgi:predicted enzyme involved in methoxymalonyl-ACP biosynthesis